MPTKRSTVAVVGLGYVGLPLALLAARKGYKVLGIDIDQKKLKLLRSRVSPFRDEKISQALQKVVIIPTNDFSKVKDADIIVLCLPTPVDKKHAPDLKPVISACESIAPWLKKGQLIILESTVNPGVSERVVLPILERRAHLKAGTDFYLAHCPERVDPGNARWTLERIPRVVGSLEEVGLAKAVNFYQTLLKAKVTPMASLQEAEAVKIVENTFRDINIAFVNELAMSFTHLKIDVVKVINAAATKPFSFLPHFPGCGVGGHCIPVDPYYLIAYAQQNGFSHEFLKLARRINNHMPAYTVSILREALRAQGIHMRNTRVAVLGLAYKPEIDDCRESPAFKVIASLRRLGVRTVSYDPFVEKSCDAATLEEALIGAKAVVITTAHRVFAALKPKDFLRHGVRVVVDGRNCLSKEAFIKAGLTYKGIGR